VVAIVLTAAVVVGFLSADQLTANLSDTAHDHTCPHIDRICQADQGMALPAVLRCKPGKSYDHHTHWSGPDPQRSPPIPTTVRSSSLTGRSPCGSASVPP
jgi:hypothetical protein